MAGEWGVRVRTQVTTLPSCQADQKTLEREHVSNIQEQEPFQRPTLNPENLAGGKKKSQKG